MQIFVFIVALITSLSLGGPQFNKGIGRMLGTQASSSITGTSGVWVNVTPATMSVAVDVTGATHYSGYAGTDGFGPSGLVADPTRAGTFYTACQNQGIWKSTDYGLTWTYINTGTGGSALDGTSWSIAIPPSGAYLLANNGYGSDQGVRKSTDGGVSWTKKSGGVDPGDVNRILISPTDSNHVFLTPHGSTGSFNYYESTDGGENWSDIGTNAVGNSSDGLFIDDTTIVLVSPNGIYRGVKSGTWSWTHTYGMDGPHGGVQMVYDSVSGYVYVGGINASSFLGNIIRSNDGGQTWTLVQDNAGGFGPATVWMTGTKLYAFGSYATHASYGPIAWRATRTSGASWTDIQASLDAGMTNGPHSVAVATDGARWVMVLANVNAGLWRFIE